MEGLDLLSDLVETYLDIQKNRVAIGNRISARERRGLDVPFGLVRSYEALRREEELLARDIKEHMKELEVPIYDLWLKNIRGVAELLSAQLLAKIKDIGRFKHVSNLYSYSGYGVFNGVIQSPKKKSKTNYRRDLKTILHKIGDNILMGKDPYYRAYYEYFKKKEEKKNKPRKVPLTEDVMGEYLARDIPELDLKAGTIIKKRVYRMLKRAGYKEVEIVLSKGHIHMRAKRKMIKLFLAHLYEVWRRLEGLPVDVPYSIARNYDAYIPPPYLPGDMKCLACEHRIIVNKELDFTGHAHV